MANLHAGGAANWEASDALLRLLDGRLRAGMRTLETGAGRSTLMFAAKGAAFTTPSPPPATRSPASAPKPRAKALTSAG